MSSRFILLSIILVSALLLCFYQIKNVSDHWGQFTEKFDPVVYEKLYNRSQYMVPQSKFPISDEQLLSHAGYKYATGTNPILINSDHPPLGKYIIGWITLLTGNNRVSSLFFGLGAAVLLYYIVFTVSGSHIASLITLCCMFVDTVFSDQIRYSPILDIIQVFFLLLFLTCTVLYIKNKKLTAIILAGIALGCMSAVKLYFPAIIALMVSCGYLLFSQVVTFRKTVLYGVIVSALMASVYTLSYLQLFLQGGNLRTFLGTQKWIFLFWQQNSVVKSGADYTWGAFSLILFNKWKVWWGTSPTLPFEHWTYLWPIFFIVGFGIALYLTFTLALQVFKNKKNKKPFIVQIMEYVSLWIIAATFYLNMLPLSPRYLMILFFPIYLLIGLSIAFVLKTYKPKLFI